MGCTVNDITKMAEQNCGLDYRIDEKHYVINTQHITENLKQDEEVLTAVIARKIHYHSDLDYGVLVATNKRIIIAAESGVRKRIPVVSSVSIEDVNTVTAYSVGFIPVFACIQIDIRVNDRIFLEMVSKKEVNKMASALLDAIATAKERNTTETTASNQVSAADELMKFKNLLDVGIISQDEFDAKKKQLLGL